LRYIRGKKAGEQRLVSKGSIGIGGHMNDHDEGLFALDDQAYLAGVLREVEEEVRIAQPISNRIVALLNDDSTEVGQVHLGVIHVITLERPVAEKRESVITSLKFLTPEELRTERESLEGWSQICVDHLGKLVSR
jgi:predicted NUDIX family phosphoesterase